MLLSGCATLDADLPKFREQISYYDRNGDGKADLETHHHPAIADADWELRDDDYNGRYERKIFHGLAVKQSIVDIPVPTDVKIQKKQ